jgi:hypothetical protein
MARPRKNAAATASMADEAAEAARVAAQEQREAQLSATKDVAVKTMTGDLRDRFLAMLKYEQDKRPWSERSEEDQRGTIHAVESAIQDYVRSAVELIAAGGLPTIKATLDQVVVKDGMKLILLMDKTHEQRLQIMDAVGGTVLLVVADASAFMGEREPVPIKPDQGDIEDVLVQHSTDEEASVAPAVQAPSWRGDRDFTDTAHSIGALHSPLN